MPRKTVAGIALLAVLALTALGAGCGGPGRGEQSDDQQVSGIELSSAFSDSNDLPSPEVEETLVDGTGDATYTGDTDSIELVDFKMLLVASRGKDVGPAYPVPGKKSDVAWGIAITGKAKNLSSADPVRLSFVVAVNEINNSYPLGEKFFKNFDIPPGSEVDLEFTQRLALAMEVTGIETAHVDVMLGPCRTVDGQEVAFEGPPVTEFRIPPGSLLREEETPGSGPARCKYEIPMNKEDACRFVDSYFTGEGVQRDVLPTQDGSLVRRYSGSPGAVLGGDPGEYNLEGVLARFSEYPGSNGTRTMAEFAEFNSETNDTGGLSYSILSH